MKKPTGRLLNYKKINNLGSFSMMGKCMPLEDVDMHEDWILPDPNAEQLQFLTIMDTNTPRSYAELEAVWGRIPHWVLNPGRLEFKDNKVRYSMDVFAVAVANGYGYPDFTNNMWNQENPAKYVADAFFCMIYQ
jgi:hypothetical protein